jgi:5-methylcytosine-specific restriction endonuclease McrA
MCDVCTNEMAKTYVAPPKFKITPEQKLLLKGKNYSAPVDTLSPEQLEEHRLYRRSYDKLHREWRRSNGDNYQKAYQKIYKRNHASEIHEYVTEYRKKNPEYSARHDRRRRARKAQVYSERYSKEDVLEAHGTSCYLCGGEIDMLAPRSPGLLGWQKGLHLDHVIPISAGGADAVYNIKPAHGLCNMRKNSGIPILENDVESTVKVLFTEIYGQPKKGRPLIE